MQTSRIVRSPMAWERLGPGLRAERTRSMLGVVAVALVVVVTSCGRSRQQSAPLFELLSPETTGVSFVNELRETPAFNILNYLNFYNGGGVAAGDIDNDGLPDLYFTSNLGTDRLYRNLGDFRFEDITDKAGVRETSGWKAGVTMADVNGDGFLDIYVSTVTHLSLSGRNVLFVNNGNGTFTDRTAEYGLAHVGYSTQAAFFDYDGDGDLDAYLLNHSTHEQRGSAWNPQRTGRHPTAGDLLFRNDGNHFVDVSEASGIYGGAEGYGLGIVVSDLDLDGCPDIYVANDFDESDFLYFNNCRGFFEESVTQSTGHTSLSSMGVDAADVTNDGRPDIVVLDMLPDQMKILNTSSNSDDFAIYDMKIRAGYYPQFLQNTLQLNRGRRHFSEIGHLAGVEATDWSWAPLLADLDNDGYKDLFITNGIYRRPNDLDYISYVADRAVQAAFGDGITEELLATLLSKMPQVPLPNHAYHNNGDLTFTNMAGPWGLGQPGFSTGATYVDLNRDGALDLVVNNINAPAGIYRNNARTINGNHFLSVQLRGAGANTAGVGAKVIVQYDDESQLIEQMPTRGFQSSVEPLLHVGLGVTSVVDSLIVIWPDRRYQVLRDVSVDRTIELWQDSAGGRYVYSHETNRRPLFEDVTSQIAIDFKHDENTFFDYNREPLIPHMLSTEGPALAVGDANGDGLDDIYVGGAKWQSGRLLVQERNGRFHSVSDGVFQADSLHEDVDAVFFDADGDGDQDLYVVSGGNEFWDQHEPLLDRLYVNDGSGGYVRSVDLLPAVYQNGSCVRPGDFDGDGDLDLFLGSRVVSRQYGLIPPSYLLENDGTGHFRDVTLERAPALTEAGMVSSAAWVDYDADGQLDLIVVGEWMPIRVFQQDRGRFVDHTTDAGFSQTEGWWNSVVAVDLRASGHMDLVLGNLGKNARIQASPQEPTRLYIKDFAQNGALQQIMTSYHGGVSYTLAGRDELLRAIPTLRDKFPTYASFGAGRIQDIFTSSELRDARVREAYQFESAVALNNGNGSFHVQQLPTEAQFAPIYATVPADFDGDGHTDIVVAGNFWGVPPSYGRYDASYGLLLRGDGAGGLTPVDVDDSALLITGQVRDMRLLQQVDGGKLLVVARNNAPLQLLRLVTPVLRSAATTSPQ